VGGGRGAGPAPPQRPVKPDPLIKPISGNIMAKIHVIKSNPEFSGQLGLDEG
jgi:hypothetical protein